MVERSVRSAVVNALVWFVALACFGSMASAAGLPGPRLAPGKQAGFLYLAGPDGVTIYSQSTLQLVGQLASGIDDPRGVAIDAAGNAYVANPYLALFFQSYNDVAVFPPGATAPSLTYADGLVSPAASAVAPDGTLYVLDAFTRNITVFANGSARFSRMEFPARAIPTSLAVDGSGNLFVGYLDLPYTGKSHIAEFAPGGRESMRLPLTFASLVALAFDTQGNLLAANAQAGTISVYPPGATTPTNVLQGFTQGIFSITLNAAGDRLFVANGYEVDEVAYPSGKAIGKIPGQGINVFSVAASPPLIPTARKSLAQPEATPVPERISRSARGWLAPGFQAAAGAGLLYVADSAANTIDIFPRERSRRLIGQITQGVSGPTALGTDAAANLYVANSAANNVTVYAAGNTQPSATYTKGIAGPNGLAIDAQGTLYVSNGGGKDITEYPAGSLAPAVTIRGVYTLGLGVDAAGNLYDLVGGASGSDSTASIYKYPAGSKHAVFTGIELASTEQGASGFTVSSNGTLAVFFGDLICFAPGSTNAQYLSMGNVVGAAFSPTGNQVWATDSVFGTADQLTYPNGNHNNAIDIGSPSGIAVTGP